MPPGTANRQSEDRSFVPQLTGVRFVGRIPGRYTLPSRKTETGVSVFACRTQGISALEATLSAPVAGRVGDPVSANFDDIGLVKGQISTLIENGFRMEIDPATTDVEKLELRIEWLKRRLIHNLADNRKHKRVLPRNPNTTLILGDGTRVKAFIIDMSSSGVAVSADLRPRIGTPLAVGVIIGRVVRHLPAGFAVHFQRDQDLATLEQRMAPQKDFFVV